MKKLLSALAAALAVSAGAAALGAGAVVETPSVSVAHPSRIAPGEPFSIALSGAGAERAVRTMLAGADGRMLSGAAVFPLGADEAGRHVRAALLAVPNGAASGKGFVRLIDKSGGTVYEREIEILGRKFEREDIPLDQANSALRTAPDPKKTAEAELLWKELMRFDPAALRNFEPFRSPVESTRRTAGFGDRRVYVYADGSRETSVHAGIDFGVPAGTAVMAAARGKVVFARDRIVTGKSVIIEHLPGLYSLYYHLSRIDAEEGSLIEQGDKIGLSGSTGLSTGPHLHWEVRVSGEAADPDALIAGRILDKDAILSKITGPSSSDQR